MLFPFLAGGGSDLANCCWWVRSLFKSHVLLLLFLQVPSGPIVLWSNFGANQGKLDPGMKTCWPVWNSVSVLVSKQVITYNAAPKKCPTKDMIFVDGMSHIILPSLFFYLPFCV
jgi:hypothetical protein